jgi:hypothetical protein
MEGVNISERPTDPIDIALSNTKEMLQMTLRGLQESASPDPRRRRAGLMHLIIYGRTVTFTLQKLRPLAPDFDDWYPPIQQEMSTDPLMVFFNKLRTTLEMEGQLGARGMTIVDLEKQPGGTFDMGALFDWLYHVGPPTWCESSSETP